MPRTLTSTLHAARTVLAQAKGWLWFLEIERFAGGYFRLVSASRHVQADGKVWQAAGFTTEVAEERSDSSAAEMSIAIPNVSRLPLAAVELDDELLGAEVTLWLQHESALASFAPGLSWRHRVASATADESVMVLACGRPGPKRVPGVRFTRAKFPQLRPEGGVRT